MENCVFKLNFKFLIYKIQEIETLNCLLFKAAQAAVNVAAGIQAQPHRSTEPSDDSPPVKVKREKGENGILEPYKFEKARKVLKFHVVPSDSFFMMNLCFQILTTMAPRQS